MTLDNGQYFDLHKNYQLVYEYLTSYCGLEPQTLDFAFDTYGLNEETFEDLNERQGLNQFDFEEFLKESWEEYEEEQEEEEEENEEESEKHELAGSKWGLLKSPLTTTHFRFLLIIKMKLKTNWGKTYDLELIESNYTHNNKKYYGLIDKEDGESFADITINIPDGNHEFNYIDNDFFLCFEDKKDCFDWIKKNLKATECGIDWNGWNYFRF